MHAPPAATSAKRRTTRSYGCGSFRAFHGAISTHHTTGRHTLIMATTEQQQTEANTTRQQAETIRVLMSVGFEDMDQVVEAVTKNDLSVLIAADG